MKKLWLLLAVLLLSINWTAAQTPSVTINGVPPPYIFNGTGVSQSGQTFTFSSTGGGDAITSPHSTLAVGGSPGATTLDVVGGAGQILAGATPALTSTPTLGASGTIGTISFGNATSGLITLGTVTGALGTVTASLPANTGIIAELNLAQTFSAVQTISATNGLVLSAMTGTTCLEQVSGVVTSTGSACGSGGGTTTNALTLNNSNSGAASGTTFNGSAAVTLSANTIGAGSLANANTWSAANIFSAAGTASTPGLSVTGAPYTAGSATTNFPQLYINAGTGPTTFSTAGTEFGVNSPSGFTGNMLDFHVNGGASVAKLDYQGNLTVASCSGCGSVSLAFPLTVSGTTTSGGVPYFSATTTLSSSGILNSNILVKGGGAGTAPTNSSITDTGSAISTAEPLTLGTQNTTAGSLTVTGSASAGGGFTLNGTGSSPGSTSCSVSTAGTTLTCASTGSSVLGIGVAGSATGSLQLNSSTATGSVTITPASAASAFTATIPAATDTIVELTQAQTLTNKTISGSSNTLSNIANASLTNSAITIAGTSVSLGGSTSSFPSPGAIGGTTPAAITGTTIQANTQINAGSSGTLAPIVMGNATSGTLTLQPATGAITSYTIDFPVAQPTAGNTFLSCTAANPAVCTWAAGGGGSSALSSITAATGANTIASGNNVAQIWNWAMTANTEVAMTFGETTAATSGTLGNQYIGKFTTAAGSTAVPLDIANSLTGSQTLPTLHITPTWNTTGVVDAALLVNPTNTASGTGSLLADFQLGGTSEASIDKAGNIKATSSISSGTAPSCTAGTAGGFCLTEGSTNITNTSGNAAIDASSTTHELAVATNGSTSFGVLVRSQPGAIRSTGLVASVATATLCAASAGACNVAGTYHVHIAMYQSGTACTSNATGGVSFQLTWTDANGTAHSAQTIPIIGNSLGTTATGFITNGLMLWGATSLGSYASGDINIDTNGTVIQYATTFSQCSTTGTATYALSAAATRLQ